MCFVCTWLVALLPVPANQYSVLALRGGRVRLVERAQRALNQPGPVGQALSLLGLVTRLPPRTPALCLFLAAYAPILTAVLEERTGVNVISRACVLRRQ